MKVVSIGARNEVSILSRFSHSNDLQDKKSIISVVEKEFFANYFLQGRVKYSLEIQGHASHDNNL